MDMIRKKSKSFLFLIFAFWIWLFNADKILASAVPAGTNFCNEGLDLSGDRSTNKGDKEVEDTIREINRFTLSDSLWKMWRAIEDSQYVVAKIDTMKSLKTFNKGVKLAREAFDLISELKQPDLDSLVKRKIKLKAILLFEKARADFEQTFKLNPLDMKTQTYLIWVFQNLAELYDHCDNTLRAISMLEYLTYILNDDSKLYYTLGEKYFNIGKWDQALANVRTSIELILDDDWNKIDTKQLFWHYHLRANTEIQLDMIPEALLSLNYAKLIAPTEIESKEVQKKIDWINWDDGNLAASRKSDSLDTELNQGTEDYLKIKQEYLNLLNQVRTDKARQDINWRIAQLEFNFLREREKAVERMLKVVQQVKFDSTNKVEEVRCQKYIEDFCTMCYILGMEHLGTQHYKKAFVYFYQSTEFGWSQIGKCYLQLAKLSSLDNCAVLKFGQQAFANESQLTNEERSTLYHLFYMAYKRLGKFDDATFWIHKTNNFSMGN